MCECIYGLKTPGGQSPAYDWRVFVSNREQLERWSSSLGPDLEVVCIGAQECERFARCECDRLYSWGEAPVLPAPAPPDTPAARSNHPMWHPRASQPHHHTYHISPRTFARSELTR